MRLLDRYIIRSFLVNYLLAFGVLVGMYVLLDLIINVGNFTKGQVPTTPDAGGLALFLGLVRDIGDYYSYQVLVIFQQVSPAIPLLAAGFTMVRMTRHHELTGMLASGVSLYRVATPIVLCALGFSALVILDQELLMPQCADKLLRRHEDVGRPVARIESLYFVRDADNSLLISPEYDASTRTMKQVGILLRDPDGKLTGRLLAPEAVWQKSPEGSPLPGSWLMKNARQIDDAGGDPAHRVAEQVREVNRVTKLTPDQLDLAISKKAVEFLSSSQIQTLINTSPDVTKPGLEKIMHTRFTQPIMNVVMLLIGIPFLLTREPRRLIRNMMICVVVAGFCFVGTFVMYQMAGRVVPSLLGAWLPVLIFGPASLAMLDTIKT